MLVFLSVVFAQAPSNILVFDDFTVGAGVHGFTTPPLTQDIDVSTGSVPISQYEFFGQPGCTGLIGCGRDMNVTITKGLVGRSFSSNIYPISKPSLHLEFLAEWAISNPKEGSSTATLTYDGPIDDGHKLNLNGLGNKDLTVGGQVLGFRLFAIIDLNVTYSINLYSPNGGVCTSSFLVKATPASYTLADITNDFFYSGFTNGCDRSNIGAISFVLPCDDAVDVLLREMTLIGVFASPTPSSTPSASPSASPSMSGSQGPSSSSSSSQTPGPSQSQTPGPSQSQTPAPSQSNSNTPSSSFIPSASPSSSSSMTPSRSATMTPTKSPQCSTICLCPVFSCHLIFGFQDPKRTKLFYN